MAKRGTIRQRLTLPQCAIGLQGKCCRNCLMGPCLTTKAKGVCGASQDVVIARNILRFTAAGAACHAGHVYHLRHFLGKKLNFESFKEISEALHTSTMGVDADCNSILRRTIRMGMIDGYCLSCATELEDAVYGKPKVKRGLLDLGVISKDKINIAVHGHEPMLTHALAEEIKKPQNADINLVGVCCIGAALLARHGIPLAANFVLQEDVIATGAIEAMVVDLECIMPSLANLCECYHTKLITTSKLCHIPGAFHMPIESRAQASKIARKIIEIARKNRKNRKKVSIKNVKKEAVVGFTEDNLPLNEWVKQIEERKIKGIIGVIGCTNPRVSEDWISCYEKLSNNYIILTTGCIAFKLGQAGLLDGKRFFHLGSCIHNARLAEVFRKVAKLSKQKITAMPFLVSCPMPITEKAIAMAFFFASLGIDVHFGYPSFFSGIKAALEKVLKEFESKILLEASPRVFLQKCSSMI